MSFGVTLHEVGNPVSISSVLAKVHFWEYAEQDIFEENINLTPITK